MSYVVMVIPTHGLVLPLTLHGRRCEFATEAEASTIADLMFVCVRDGTRYQVAPDIANAANHDDMRASALPLHRSRH